MKKALIFEGKIVQIEYVVFPVAPDLIWIDAPADATMETHIFDGVAVVLKMADPIREQKTAFITKVKFEAGAFTTQTLKNLESEYALAEKEAAIYKDLGYTGAIPNTVQAEINSKLAKGLSISATVACDNILTAAMEWRNVQYLLRNTRLTVASAAEAATNEVELDAVKTQWKMFMVSIYSQLDS